MTKTDKYEIVVGLEVHAQLSTKSKIFCNDPTDFGAEPNTQVSTVSLAHPGTLPVMNKEVISSAITLGLALNCSFNRESYFERKNYSYPDLPKGYQVTQQAKPICIGGKLQLKEKSIRLNRIHMEEDAGKSIHDNQSDFTNIDLNRAGVPLLEIVSEPDLRSGDEAYEYLTELRKIVRWLNVCDGNMEEGSMRCDANISVRLKGETTYGTRVEVKNLNSIRNVKKAIELEAGRLVNMIEHGETIEQETRSYDADQNITFSLRSKEDANDYRYFPEPDLPFFYITDTLLNNLREALPQLPESIKNKYITEYGLNEYDAAAMTADKETYSFFESVISYHPNYKSVANWIHGPLKYYCNENNFSLSNFPLSATQTAALIALTDSGKLHVNTASTKLLQEMILTPDRSAESLAESLNLIQQSDDNTILQWIDHVLDNMPEKVAEYKKGKKALQGLFAGEVKKLSKGKADMQLVNQLLLKKLN